MFYVTCKDKLKKTFLGGKHGKRTFVVGSCLENHGQAAILNTDQGSQSTSEACTGILKSKDIKISMEGNGRALAKVFVERIWRTVKHDEVDLKGFRNGSECREGLCISCDRYNSFREHQALAYTYPTEIDTGESLRKEAA